MKTKIALLPVISVLLFLVLSGCANDTVQYTVPQMETVPSETERKTIQNVFAGENANEAANPINTNDWESRDYSYETVTMYGNNNGKQIYGRMYLPIDAGEQMPAVIYSHGYGGTNASGRSYAEALARKGIVTYCFDFRGGSPQSQSDGTTTEMSVFTEATDLEAVIAMLQGLDYVDNSRIFLMGSSQGGMVSAMVGAEHKDEIRGMVLLYPAFLIPESARDMYDSIEDVPETVYHLWMTIGRAYYENLLDYDVYEHIAAYDKDVLILHGDADSLVGVSYSEKAVEVYQSAKLIVLKGAGHGFSGSDFESAISNIYEYIKDHLN